MFLIVGLAVGYLLEKEKAEGEFPQKKEEALKGSRAVTKGKVSENFALLIPDFQKQFPDLNLSEARFMGGPIDYLFFEGMDEKKITKVVFLEVKSGKHPRLNENESSLKDAIDDAEKKGASVIWREYKIPEDTTENPEN